MTTKAQESNLDRLPCPKIQKYTEIGRGHLRVEHSNAGGTTWCAACTVVAEWLALEDGRMDVDERKARH